MRILFQSLSFKSLLPFTVLFENTECFPEGVDFLFRVFKPYQKHFRHGLFSGGGGGGVVSAFTPYQQHFSYSTATVHKSMVGWLHWGLMPLLQLRSYHGGRWRTCVSWLSHTSTKTTFFFPKPPTTFLTCLRRDERRKYAGKKITNPWFLDYS